MQVMVFNAQSTRFGPLSLFVLSIVRGTAPVLTSLGAKRVTPTVCSAAEYHQFDFWLGDWDSFEFSRSTRDAHVRINRILDGCVIHEDDQSVVNAEALSFVTVDASRKVWHHSWVTNRGQLLIIEGNMLDSAMVRVARIALLPEKNAMSAEFGSELKAA
jgi:hypothetical protein